MNPNADTDQETDNQLKMFTASAQAANWLLGAWGWGRGSSGQREQIYREAWVNVRTGVQRGTAGKRPGAKPGARVRGRQNWRRYEIVGLALGTTARTKRSIAKTSVESGWQHRSGKMGVAEQSIWRGLVMRMGCSCWCSALTPVHLRAITTHTQRERGESHS